MSILSMINWITNNHPSEGNSVPSVVLVHGGRDIILLDIFRNRLHTILFACLFVGTDVLKFIEFVAKYFLSTRQIITAIFAEGEVGIDEAEVQNIKVYNEGLRLFVRGAEGQRVSVYDALGRCVYHSYSYNEMAVTLPSTGVFVVRVNEAQPRKIAVF